MFSFLVLYWKTFDSRESKAAKNDLSKSKGGKIVHPLTVYSRELKMRNFPFTNLSTRSAKSLLKHNSKAWTCSSYPSEIVTGGRDGCVRLFGIIEIHGLIDFKW